MFACVNIQEEIGERSFQSCAPTFVESESRASDFRCGGQIENSCALAHFPMRARFKVKRWRDAPAPHFDVIGGAVSYGNRGVRYIGDGEQEFALDRVQFR